MVYYYAQIDLKNTAVGVSQLSGPVEAANMIPITEEQYNTGSVMGCTYDAATGSWISPPPQPIDATGSIPITEV
jgi:hypothetical protein